jgi:hypothetical protein
MVETFPGRSETRQRCSFSLLLINVVLEVSDKGLGKRKK